MSGASVSQNGEKSDLSDFDHGMIVGARRAGLSISATAELLGFLRTTVYRVYSEWDREVPVMQITTHYYSGMQNSISEHTMCQTSKWIGVQQQKT